MVFAPHGGRVAPRADTFSEVRGQRSEDREEEKDEE
jgi:hypothetical protein